MHANGFAFEIRDVVNAFPRKQFKAAHMLACQDRDRLSSVNRYDERRGEVRSKIDIAACEGAGGGSSGVCRNVADIGETFSAQELIGDILGCDTDAGDFRNADCGRFQSFVLTARPCRADETGPAGCRECGKEMTSTLYLSHHVSCSPLD